MTVENTTRGVQGWVEGGLGSTQGGGVLEVPLHIKGLGLRQSDATLTGVGVMRKPIGLGDKQSPLTGMECGHQQCHA